MSETVPGRAMLEASLAQEGKIARGQQAQAAPWAEEIDPAHIASQNIVVAAPRSPVEVEAYTVLRFPQVSPKNVFLTDYFKKYGPLSHAHQQWRQAPGG